ncbi:MAG: DUF3822 family protein [Sphingobacteriales bacterium]|nr:DUF3822 family protein [Sphingobacteriales bacterium]
MKELFTIENPAVPSVQQVLSLRLGNRHLGYAITNRTGEELYKLGYFRTEETDGAALAELLEQTPALKEAFYSVQVAYDFAGHSLLSSTGYRPEESGNMLKALFGINGNEAVITENIAEWQLYNVYAVPAELLHRVQQYFPAAQCRHQFSLAIKQLQGAGDTAVMLVDFRQDDFSILVTRQSRLLLAQTYAYSTPEDVLYYLLKAVDQLGLSQQELDLQVSGLIDRDSALFKEIVQYFIQVEFRESPWQGLEHPAHYFTSLNDLARCAS